MMTLTDTTPRAWVGCLACYNSGRLEGDWVDGLEAGEFIPCKRPGHEEWWVLDHEGYAGLIPGECSPARAQELAEILDDVHDVEAFGAFASYFGEPDLEVFEDAYAGEWDSLEDYAWDLIESIGMLDNVNESVARYFDVRAFARDLELGGDVWTAPAPGLAVYVFRSI